MARTVKDKTTKAKSQTPAVDATTKPAEVAPTNPVTTTPATTEEPDLEEELSASCIELSAKLQNLCTQSTALKNEFKNLEKRFMKEIRTLCRAQARKKIRAHRQPSGFVKPARISDELADFLQKTKGSEMARTDVTREINAYIRKNNLQDSVNGRKINADSKLQKLLKVGTGDELTYFNLQKFMSPHFYKENKSADVKV